MLLQLLTNWRLLVDLTQGRGGASISSSNAGGGKALEPGLGLAPSCRQEDSDLDDEDEDEEQDEEQLLAVEPQTIEELEATLEEVCRSRRATSEFSAFRTGEYNPTQKSFSSN